MGSFTLSNRIHHTTKNTHKKILVLTCKKCILSNLQKIAQIWIPFVIIIHHCKQQMNPLVANLSCFSDMPYFFFFCSGTCNPLGSYLLILIGAMVCFSISRKIIENAGDPATNNWWPVAGVFLHVCISAPLWSCRRQSHMCLIDWLIFK